MWCLGVAYVTTNHVGLFSAMKKPSFFMDFETYHTLVIIWEIFFGLSALVLAGLTYRALQLDREKPSPELEVTYELVKDKSASTD
jgi:hypothetical protein